MRHQSPPCWRACSFCFRRFCDASCFLIGVDYSFGPAFHAKSNPHGRALGEVSSTFLSFAWCRFAAEISGVRNPYQKIAYKSLSGGELSDATSFNTLLGTSQRTQITKKQQRCLRSCLCLCLALHRCCGCSAW